MCFAKSVLASRHNVSTSSDRAVSHTTAVLATWRVKAGKKQNNKQGREMERNAKWMWRTGKERIRKWESLDSIYEIIRI